MSFAPLAAKDIRGVIYGGYMQVVYPILLNMQSHSRKTTGTVTPFDKYAAQSRSDCYAAILLNMQRHSREATVMPRPSGEAASNILKQM